MDNNSTTQWFAVPPPLDGNNPVFNEITTGPGNFDHVERYVSNLPIERVKNIRIDAEVLIKMYGNFKEEDLDEADRCIITLSGHILELTN